MIDTFSVSNGLKKNGFSLKCQVFERETTHGEEVQLLRYGDYNGKKTLTP